MKVKKKLYNSPIAEFVELDYLNPVAMVTDSIFESDEDERGDDSNQQKEHIGSWEDIWGTM